MADNEKQKKLENLTTLSILLNICNGSFCSNNYQTENHIEYFLKDNLQQNSWKEMGTKLTIAPASDSLKS